MFPGNQGRRFYFKEFYLKLISKVMFSPINHPFAKPGRKGFSFLFAGFLLMSCLTGPVMAQSVNATKGGKGLQFVAADTSFSLKLNTRIQSLYSGVYNLDEEEYSDRILIRRARLKLEGFAYHPSLQYKLELGLSNNDIGGVIGQTNNTANVILDALVRWQINDNFSLLMGQTKLPGNRERVISSQKLQFVDRSLLNSGYNIDRDAGVQLAHTFAIGKAVFREVASVSMGEGRNITTANSGGYDYTGRVEILPLGEFASDGDYSGSDLSREETPKLAIGVTYDYNDGASRERGQLGSFFSAKRDLKTLFADAMFKYQGFSAMAEYANKKASGTPVVERTELGEVSKAFFTGTAFNVQAGYLFPSNFEVAGRYTHVDPQAVTERAEETQYTLGVSRYLIGHTVKVQSDVSLLKEATDFNELMYRFQVEIGF
jgi:phosphate-selective porin OprO and OprP